MAVKVVIDTNIFISSFYGGNPEKIIKMWLSGDITLCLSSATVEEYVATLRRMRPTLGNQIEKLLDSLGRSSNLIFTTKTPKLSVVESDPDDDKFIECAVALKAEYIVTGDKALLAIGKYGNTEILTPQLFLEIVTP